MSGFMTAKYSIGKVGICGLRSQVRPDVGIDGINVGEVIDVAGTKSEIGMSVELCGIEVGRIAEEVEIGPLIIEFLSDKFSSSVKLSKGKSSATRSKDKSSETPSKSSVLSSKYFLACL